MKAKIFDHSKKEAHARVILAQAFLDQIQEEGVELSLKEAEFVEEMADRWVPAKRVSQAQLDWLESIAGRGQDGDGGLVFDRKRYNI